jgi:hypothetical protein
MRMSWHDLWAWQEVVDEIERRSRRKDKKAFFNDWYWDITPVG